jgi:hypothetical protein
MQFLNKFARLRKLAFALTLFTLAPPAWAGDSIPPTLYPQTSDTLPINVQWRIAASEANAAFAMSVGAQACTNAVTVVTNAATAGQVWASGVVTNFFGTAGGVARLNTFTYVNPTATNYVPLEVFLFSRPPTTPTNNAAWGPTSADMLYLCNAFTLGNSDFRAAGANMAVGAKNGLLLTVCNTYTNQNLYYVMLAGTGNTVSNATTTHYVSFR